MPELKWDEFDFFYCLEVEPEIGDYGVSYEYKVRRDDFVLYLTVRPLESVVELSVYQGATEITLLDCALFVFGEARYINDKRGEYLEFESCILAPRRFSRIEAERLWEAATPSWSVQLSTKPSLQFRYVVP